MPPRKAVKKARSSSSPAEDSDQLVTGGNKNLQRCAGKTGKTMRKAAQEVDRSTSRGAGLVKAANIKVCQASLLRAVANPLDRETSDNSTEGGENSDGVQSEGL
jgi:hypothetical protein